MSPIVIRNSIVPRLCSIVIDVYAITLFPFIFVRDEGNWVTINHESIHIKQQAELFVIPFYIIYVYQWIRNLIKGMSGEEAYYNIQFEYEAYQNQAKPDYLETRKRMAWKQSTQEKKVV